MTQLTETALDEAARLLVRVTEAIAAELDGPPTLGDVLAVLDWSVPNGSEHMAKTPVPVTFRAKVKGNKWYKAPDRDVVLDDGAYVEAVELLGFLAARGSAVSGQQTTAEDLASYLLQVLKAARPAFADVDEVADLQVKVAKGRRKFQVGDVIGVPAGKGGYHFAVIVAVDNWGPAVGLLQGVHASPQLGPADGYRARHVPVYPGQDLIQDGTWPIVGHDENLLALFPDPPEIYFSPNPVFPQYGKFGAAGTADGRKRVIGEAEAGRAGLLDQSYEQFVSDELFQQRLDEGYFDKGMVPGFWKS